MKTIKKIPYLLLILGILCSLNLYGQSRNEIYRNDLSEFLKLPYDFPHTFIHASNDSNPHIDCNDIEEIDSLLASALKPMNFLNNIIDVIPKETNTIIISENHIAYKSRVLLLDFVKLLKEEGYTDIYMEALAYDKDLSVRKYPTNKSGYYLSEPICGNLVRKLLKEGFSLHPYEELKFQQRNSKKYVQKHLNEEITKSKLDRKSINNDQYKFEFQEGFLNMSTRDYSQYINIMQTWSTTKKSIIICGHSHGMKLPYGGWRSLGYWLSLNPKVKLFSIENSEAIGQYEEDLNKLTCFFNQEEPYYLFSEQDSSIYNEFRFQPYENKNINGLFDMNIFYSINYFESNLTPLSTGENCEEILFKNDSFKTPFIIVKYLLDEYNIEKEKALPIDIELVSSANTTTINRCENEIVFIWDGNRKHELK